MDKKILWFDIETAPETNDFDNYPKRRLWESKMIEKGITETFNKSYMNNSGLYPEFARVVCISYMIGDKTKSLIGSDEFILLQQFNDILESMNDVVLGGFNINSFDIPFLRKRMIINGINPTQKLCLGNKAPREIQTVDVFQIWRQTSFSCSLDLLSMTLLGESPKSDLSGDLVGSCFYADNLSQIQKYCEGDVLFTKRCYEAIINMTANRKPVVEEKSVGINVVVETDVDLEPIDEPKDTPEEKPRFNDPEYNRLAEKKEFIKSFAVEGMLLEEVEKRYRVSQIMKEKIGKLRRDTRSEENGSKVDDDLPF